MTANLEKLVKHDISATEVYSFVGEITAENTADILDNIDQMLNQLEIDSKTHKRLFYVCIEAIQNLYHHALEVFMNGELGRVYKFCAVKILKTNSSFEVMTWNFIARSVVEKISEHLSKINHLSKDEIKEFYKNILNNSQYTEKGGGGLGLVDIARKADAKFSFSFEPYKENILIFRLQITINSNQ